MPQIIVSIDNYSTIDKIVNAIKMLKGVSDAHVWEQDFQMPTQQIERKYSARINKLRSLCGKGISQEDIDNDERLAYLLQK
ncbi:MAG: hypothetical protein IJ417_02005 [Bacteroidaceae bacterium]|nr:hypothetical protein [Bacteroidaceae bacterium]